MLGDDDRRCGMRPARHQTKATLPCPHALHPVPICAVSPLGSTHFVSLWARCHAMPNNLSSRATARAVMTVEFSARSARPWHSATVTCFQAEFGDHAAKEIGPQPARLVEGHRPAAEDGNHQPRKARRPSRCRTSCRRRRPSPSNCAPSRICRFQSFGRRCSGRSDSGADFRRSGGPTKRSSCSNVSRETSA